MVEAYFTPRVIEENTEVVNDWQHVKIDISIVIRGNENFLNY